MRLERATGLYIYPRYKKLFLGVLHTTESNCSRYLPWYYRQIQNLPIIHPEIYADLMNSGFSCQIGSKRTFVRIPIGEIIRETINKDTQTTSGTKGFSTKTRLLQSFISLEMTVPTK